MPGVRIHHGSLRSQTMVFELPDWKYPVPFLCSTCEAVHVNKAVHLRFDAVGDCVVAEETWDKLRDHLSGEVSETGRVSDPEPMIVGMNGGPREVFQVVKLEDTHG